MRRYQPRKFTRMGSSNRTCSECGAELKMMNPSEFCLQCWEEKRRALAGQQYNWRQHDG
jgi:tRNA(Leu) C34 or U34 (ribose-2'-O)-methylase TrmL